MTSSSFEEERMSSLPALYFADYFIHDILHIQRSFPWKLSSFPGETEGKKLILTRSGSES